MSDDIYVVTFYDKMPAVKTDFISFHHVLSGVPRVAFFRAYRTGILKCHTPECNVSSSSTCGHSRLLKQYFPTWQAQLFRELPYNFQDFSKEVFEPGIAYEPIDLESSSAKIAIAQRVLSGLDSIPAEPSFRLPNVPEKGCACPGGATRCICNRLQCLCGISIANMQEKSSDFQVF